MAKKAIMINNSHPQDKHNTADKPSQDFKSCLFFSDIILV